MTLLIWKILEASLIVYNRSFELSQYNNLLLHLFSIPHHRPKPPAGASGWLAWCFRRRSAGWLPWLAENGWLAELKL
jgi:hypothetical protein